MAQQPPPHQANHPVPKAEHKVLVPTPEGPHDDVKQGDKPEIPENTRLEMKAGSEANKLVEERLKAEQDAGRKVIGG